MATEQTTVLTYRKSITERNAMGGRVEYPLISMLAQMKAYAEQSGVLLATRSASITLDIYKMIGGELMNLGQVRIRDGVEANRQIDPVLDFTSRDVAEFFLGEHNIRQYTSRPRSGYDFKDGSYSGGAGVFDH